MFFGSRSLPFLGVFAKALKPPVAEKKTNGAGRGSRGSCLPGACFLSTRETLECHTQVAAVARRCYYIYGL